MKSAIFLSLPIGLLVLLVLFNPVRGETIFPQISSGWSTPVNLSNSETQSTEPSLAVDSAGGVHVVWVEETGDGRSFISYAGLIGGYWSPANEIITSPSSQEASNPTLVADSRGYLHLVWNGDASLLYSNAFATIAGSARSWSQPQALEFVQNYIDIPSLVIDKQDQLHLVYTIQIGNKSGVYYNHTLGASKSWADPMLVYANPRSDRMVSKARIAVSTEGVLHVVWMEHNYPETYPGIGIRYTRSEDQGASWSEPLSLANGPYGDPAIIERTPAEIHVVWSGTDVDRYKFHRWSADGGKSWSSIYRNTELGGLQGWPALAVDGSQNLYWLMVGTIFSVGGDCLYATEWQAGQWLPGDAILRGPGGLGQNASNVSSGISLGNQLVTVLQYPLPSSSQPKGWQFDIYALSKLTNAIAQTPHQLVIPSLVTATPFSNPNNAATATAVIDINSKFPIKTETTNTSLTTPVLIGVVASLIVILGAWIYTKRQ